MDEIDTVAMGSVPSPGTGRVVSCELAFWVAEPAELVLQVTASDSAGSLTTERFEARSEGDALAAAELRGPHGTRSHVLHAPPGRLRVSYRSEVDTARPGRPETPAAPDGPELLAAHSRLVYLRPSRYCPSDHLVGFAVAEFGVESSVGARVQDITDWIRRRIGYVAGSSSVHDSAEHTLLTGMGTCRDFAHLGVALCRAVGIPARFASVYAPGLFPMDFHAVFEVMEDGCWFACDATDLAPRPAMVRIATGRDAADAAFASVVAGIATLESLEVTATVDDVLPTDDRAGRFQLA